MDKIKRITANLPSELVEEALSATKKNLTETLIEGLKMIRRTVAYEKAQALKGKIKLDIDLNLSRERSHR